MKMSERRDFLLKTIKKFGLAASGGLLKSGFVEEVKSAPLRDITDETTAKTPRSEKEAIDYLNEEIH